MQTHWTMIEKTVVVRDRKSRMKVFLSYSVLGVVHCNFVEIVYNTFLYTQRASLPPFLYFIRDAWTQMQDHFVDRMNCPSLRLLDLK